MSLVASLKDVMAIQETKLASASAAWEMAEQGHQHLEAKCQKLCSTCSGKPPSVSHRFFFLSLCLAVN
jgi:exonuclease III